MTVGYSNLRKEILVRLRKAITELKEMESESQQISPKEFHNYLTGETPTGDTITILDVLDNDFLMIHGIVEISELKNLGISTDKQTVMMTYPNVYGPHYTAMEYELDYAINKRNYEWLRVRPTHAKSWLDDPNMPQNLIPRCKAIIKKLAEVLEGSP